MGQLLEKPVAARREMPIPSSLKKVEIWKEVKLETVDRIRGTPMKVGRILELFNEENVSLSSNRKLKEQNAIVTFEETTREWYVPVLSIVDKGLLKVKSLVLLKCIGSWKSVPIAVVGVLPDSTEFYNDFKIENTPHETFEEIGGLDMQIQELKEAVELPLTRPEYYEEMGIVAPKGVILYGPPGTGKTLLAKAVANNTSATFLRATGSELVKKSSGEGARRIRALFKLAEENAPSIIFIDEIDAIGSKRIETSSGGEKEVQRTMLELLNQLDGFDTIADVKVIMATNRVSSLDPALIRPGRIDRKIELPEPDEKAKLSIFTIYSKMMTLAEDVDFEKLVNKARPMTGGDIKGICTEAGMSALRAHRKSVTMHDFITGMDFVLSKQKNHIEESFYI